MADSLADVMVTKRVVVTADEKAVYSAAGWAERKEQRMVARMVE